jgi:hypothetical protein
MSGKEKNCVGPRIPRSERAQTDQYLEDHLVIL